jgi:hypothetical protein
MSHCEPFDLDAPLNAFIKQSCSGLFAPSSNLCTSRSVKVGPYQSCFSPTTHMQAPNVAGCSSDSLKAPTLFQRLFDTSPVDHVDESMQAVSPLSMAGPSSNPRREPSRMSVTSAGSLVSKGPLVQPVHDLPRDPRPTGNTAVVAIAEIPPLWHSQTCPGSEGAAGTTPTTSSSRMTGQAGVQPALTQMQPVPSAVHRRHYKFWHADILSVSRSLEMVLKMFPCFLQGMLFLGLLAIAKLSRRRWCCC